MLVQPMSDLHLEFDKDGGETFVTELPVLGDVLVLAGDVLPLRTEKEIARVFGWFCQRFPQVVFVPGNHEYYGTTPFEATAKLQSVGARLANLHVLDGGMTTILGRRFVGATMWFREVEPSERPKFPNLELLNDFRLIADFVPWVYETHHTDLAFLEENVRPGDVVVTHHLPHDRSVAQQFIGSPLNRFFVADDAMPLAERSGAALWIHGHTHIPCDYLLGDTRVVCNPRGYPNERKPPMNPGLTVEV